MSDRMTFAEAVKRVRTARRLTQLALAERAGPSRTQLVRLEGGLKPGPQAYQRLVSALGYVAGVELFAAAGDAEAAHRLASYGASRAQAKGLSAPARGPQIESTRWRVL